MGNIKIEAFYNQRYAVVAFLYIDESYKGIITRHGRNFSAVYRDSSFSYWPGSYYIFDVRNLRYRNTLAVLSRKINSFSAALPGRYESSGYQ